MGGGGGGGGGGAMDSLVTWQLRMKTSDPCTFQNHLCCLSGIKRPTYPRIAHYCCIFNSQVQLYMPYMYMYIVVTFGKVKNLEYSKKSTQDSQDVIYVFIG